MTNILAYFYRASVTQTSGFIRFATSVLKVRT
jgi:hypothetical protein